MKSSRYTLLEGKGLKIEEIEVFPLRIPYKMAARIASFEYPYVESMLVRIRTSDNLFGYGEAVTDPAFTGETTDSICGAIKNHLGRAVLGSNPFALREIHEKMDQALVKNTAAKAAVEMACLDALGKATGEPIYNLLGGDFNPDIFEVPEIVIGTLTDDVRYCDEALARGVTSFKVKVGESPDKDVERVKRIREAVGDDAEIRLDANQGWRNYWMALNLAKRMDKFDISLLEQPLPERDLKGHAMLRKAIDIPIMLDESIHRVNDASAAVQLEACDVISVKIMKSGGLMRIKELVEFCSAHSISCHMGTSWETEVGWAANLSLIRGLPGIKLWDAYSPTDIYWGSTASIGTPIRTYNKNGVSQVRFPEGPGLGIAVDESAVKKYLIAEPIRVTRNP
ncbi:MAG: enolase C-terminal domain-like protein [Candidatus Bathyarchaeia archaeon]|jgi:L-alanine-DL-glutamate epimerase-like enolase superfamily enzyme